MISSGLFILPAVVFAKIGPSVLIAYLIASIFLIPAMLSKAELATAMPKAGGMFFFIDRCMGPKMGTLGGFAAWFSLSFKSAFALIGIGAFTLLLNPGFSELQIKLVAVAFCIIFTIINIIGVKHTGKTQIGLVAVLISLLVFYVIRGSFSAQFSRLIPSTPVGFGSIFAAAGLIFVSYGGLTKIASTAGEVKDPGRNIPLGMFLSWGVVSLLYILVIAVTIALVNPTQLQASLTPISLGARAFLGSGGAIIMGIAALLAFISTANAGLLAASRGPMAMSKDQLIPGFFARISKRGTPTFSILFTSLFMILVILFLDLENLIKLASTLKILLFLFATLSLIVIRESKVSNYQPKFKSPLYPYIQIAGIVGYGFLIFAMGIVPILITGIFLLCGLAWYHVYAKGKIQREYALLKVVERISGIKSKGYLLEEELREILLERDDITEERFENLIKNCAVFDLEKSLSQKEFSKKVANALAKRLKIKPERLFKMLLKREKESSIMVRSGLAIPSLMIEGRGKFAIALVRCKKGITFSEDFPPVNAAFIIVSSPDEKILNLHALGWIVEIADETDFETEWFHAKDEEELREIILSSWKSQYLPRWVEKRKFSSDTSDENE